LSNAVYTYGTDAFGSSTESWTSQDYIIVAGQAKMKDITTESVGVSIDSTITTNLPYKMEYTYAGQDALFYDALKDMDGGPNASGGVELGGGGR